jgi:hypothetical protein
VRVLLALALVLSAAGCATSQPSDINNLCAIFDEKRGWYRDADEAHREWGSPIPVMMAMMHQESRFVARAKPPRRKILGFIPGPRPSDAYGYSQALGSTWKSYIHSSGNYGADRDKFEDAVDFVGWYNHQSARRNGIPRSDAYRLYLAYHEGHGGYARRTYKNKQWLLGVARKVQRRATLYQQQLARCEAELKRGGWFWRWF